MPPLAAETTPFTTSTSVIRAAAPESMVVESVLAYTTTVPPFVTVMSSTTAPFMAESLPPETSTDSARAFTPRTIEDPLVWIVMPEPESVGRPGLTNSV